MPWNGINPFATVIMAHLKAQETYKAQQQRKAWKLLLTKRLYEQGYKREDILKLFKFIDWVIQLPQELTKTFWQELNQYEQEHSMPYITSIERLGITKGLEQGRQEEACRLLVRLLQRRFGTVTPDMQERLQSLNVDQLEDLFNLALSVPTIDELIEQLPNPAP